MNITLFKTFAFIAFLFLFVTDASAQRQPQRYVSINQKEGKHVSGKLIAINDSSVVVERVSKKQVAQQTIVLLSNINKIKIFNDKSSAVFGTVTTLAVIGNVIFAFTVDNALAAVAIGTGGTLAIVGLAALIYDLAHPPLAKLVAGRDKMDYNNVSETFKVYIEKPYMAPEKK